MRQPQRRPTAIPKARVPFWDNARFVCVTLVVIGHAIQRLTADSDNALILYLFIYAFHMPAFAMISGYFSKATPPGSRQMKKVLTDILLPYFIMETIWTLVQFIVEGKQEFNPTQPELDALVPARARHLPAGTARTSRCVRWPLLWALVFSIGVGYLANVDSTFSLSRAIGILPFFVLGWQVRQWKLVDRWRACRASHLVGPWRRGAGARRLARGGDPERAAVPRLRPALLVLLRRLVLGARRDRCGGPGCSGSGSSCSRSCCRRRCSRSSRVVAPG